MPKEIQYSEKYWDDKYEYRHVMLPPEKVKELPNPLRLLSEKEWRDLGVQQSRGWEHYAIHKPEPHVLLFRRLLAESPNPPIPMNKSVPIQQIQLQQMQMQQM